jgi:phage regulator Rha-like protein
MIDGDLAELYGVETKMLKRAVKLNITRFPEDFMFELTADVLANWRYQFGTSNREKMGLCIPPYVFTEHGVLMLASVLNNDRAVQVNIQIVRIFTKMREMLLAHKEIITILYQMERKLSEYDEKIMLLFEYIKQFERSKQEELQKQNRTKIGFIPPE